MSLKPPITATADLISFPSSLDRVPESEAESTLRLTLAGAAAGDTIDLGGLRHTLTSSVSVPAGVKVVNFDLVAGAHTAVQLGAGAVLAHGRSSRSSTGGTSGAERSNIVITGDGCRVLDVDTVGAMLANVFINANIDDVTVRGGVFKNTSRIQNASAVYAQGFVVGQDHNRLTVENVRLDSAYTAPDGILLFDTSRAIVRGNRLNGLRQLSTVTFTGWTLVSGNIYKVAERPDGNTRSLKNNGTFVTETAGTASSPGSNEWGIPGDGFVYVNLAGTNPNTRTMTSDIVGGYAITVYSANLLHDLNYNLVAHNEIEDCDGFGLYYQCNDTSHGNKSAHNTFRNCALTGLQNPTLPHSGACASRGYDYEFQGDLVEGSVYEGFWFCNTAQGVVVGATARGCTRNGFKTQTSEWNHQACESTSNTLAGYDCRTVSGDSFINLQYGGCRAVSNAGNGMSADASSGGTLSVQVNGGLYRNNTGHGIALAACINSSVDGGVKSYNNGSQQILQSGAASARIVIVNYVVPAGTSGISIAGGTDVYVGRGVVNTTTRYATTGAALLDITGTATPEGAITAAVGSRFTRTDGGANTTHYFKETGTGNTGWVGK